MSSLLDVVIFGFVLCNLHHQANSQRAPVVYNGSYIAVVKSRKGFDDARTHCQIRKGDLVIVRDSQLQNIIKLLLDPPISYNSWGGQWLVGYWIGGSKEPGSTVWNWWDGTPLPLSSSVDPYQNWIGVEPNGATSLKGCAAMTPYDYITPYRNIKGGWVDDICTRMKYFICQTDLCLPNPCQNGGTCHTFPSKYNCSCAPGYSGQNCQIDVCSPNPCNNNGSCIRKVDRYRCHCQPGYIGRSCNQDLCGSSPCQNEGTCNKLPKNYSCSCFPSFGGRNCEKAQFYDLGNGCELHINQIQSQVKSYALAQSNCTSLQASPAIIKSNETKSFFKQYQQLWSKPLPVWLGGKRINSTWMWLDGSRTGNFTNLVNQSAANGNGCLSFAPNGSSIAQDCSAAIGYACERRVNRASVSLCASSLCANGGTCTESGCHYHCICKHPFIGANCKIIVIVDTGSQASLSPLFYILPICGAVLLLVAILLIMRTKRRRNTNKQQAVHFVPERQNQPVEEVPIQQEAVYENLAIETYSETHVIPMAQLPAMLKDMFKERSRITLVTQFKNLLETAARFQDVEVTVASLPENKSKNRFKNILPFDNTRVVLSDDGSGNDYINANYIDCYSVPGKYIATQGPLQKTEADFWRMIWETESSTIVMLTNLFEKGKKKCQKYWPDFGSQRDFKQIRIACTQEEVVGCFVKRNFTINLPEDTRDVTQFHYTTWPDHSVPITTTGLHRLKQAVLEHHRKSGEDKPIVVHCSAGAGRTGCFIAFDSLTMEMRERSSINVFETVINLRKQRMDMVQTQSQYMFLHKLMAEVHVLGHTDVPMMHLESKIKELERSKRGVKSGYSVEMGKLVSLHFNERSLKYARDNNDNDIIVSYDHSRITPGINKESSYYNASFIEGYGQNERVLIAAKGPTAASIENFWYAIMANQVHTIVSLRSREEESMDPWFPFMNQPTRQTDDLTLSILDEKEIGNGITKRSLVISQSKHAKFDISFYQLTSWMPDTVPNNANDVLELIKKAQESRNELKGRILVYCNDGAGRTGAFLCILNLIERAKLEGRVDVLREVKDMRDMRVGMLHSELLYRFVYYCMAEYISTFDVYANFTG